MKKKKITNSKENEQVETCDTSKAVKTDEVIADSTEEETDKTDKTEDSSEEEIDGTEDSSEDEIGEIEDSDEDGEMDDSELEDDEYEEDEEDYETQAMKAREKAGNMSTYMLNRTGDILILHFAFLICSIPIITIGASLSATAYVGMKLAAGEEGGVIGKFLKGFKDNFKRSTIYFLMAVASAALLVLAYKYWSAVDGMVGIVMSVTTIVLACTWVMTVLYVFAVQAKFYNTFSATLKNAFLMSIRHLQYTLLMVVIIAAFVYLITAMALTQALCAVTGAGVLGIMFGKIFNKVFANYIK